jgi:hypothetical protein
VQIVLRQSRHPEDLALQGTKNLGALARGDGVMVTFGAEPADEAGRARNVVTSDLSSLKINSSSTGSWQFSVNCMPSGPQSIRVVRVIHLEWLRVIQLNLTRVHAAYQAVFLGPQRANFSVCS